MVASFLFLFFTKKENIIKAITRIAGKTAMLRNVIGDPAVPIDSPIIGNTIDVATNPAPPRIDIPSAPVFGVYSAAEPIIVGQK